MSMVIVYEVDSDRGTYWECDPNVPGLWEECMIEEDPWPTVRAISEAGYEVKVLSQESYRKWLVETHQPSD